MLTINKHKGLYWYNRMVYGCCGAPAEFQRLIDQIVRGIPGCTSYLDDTCVAWASKDEAKSRLLQVLYRLVKHGVKINLGKCQFLLKQVDYVGHNFQRRVFYPPPPNLLQLGI
jgi:hypothetical protein